MGNIKISKEAFEKQHRQFMNDPYLIKLNAQLCQIWGNAQMALINGQVTPTFNKQQDASIDDINKMIESYKKTYYPALCDQPI